MLGICGPTGATNTLPGLTIGTCWEAIMAKLSLEEKRALDNRPCESCGARLTRTFGEGATRWRSRRFCGLTCAGRARRVELARRFNDKVDRTAGHGPHGDCHLWTGGCDGKGYGAIQITGKAVGAHRVAWEMANGRPVPDGHHVMHSCDNPPCVNPDHLSPGLPIDNMADKTAKGRNNTLSGDASSWAKLSASEAKAIYHDPRSSEQIALDYPVSGAMVLRIKRGLAWRAATGAP